MITQTNAFTCEICHRTKYTTKGETAYSDPVIEYPKDWQLEYIWRNGVELEVCPECIEEGGK